MTPAPAHRWFRSAQPPANFCDPYRGRRSLRRCFRAPEPVALDPLTRETYVLVRRETCERLKGLLALDDYDPDEGAAHMNEVMADDDAKDPYLESYQHYGKKA